MKKNNPKTTILVISTGFLAIYLVFSAGWAIYISLVIGVVGIFSEKASLVIETLWMKLAKVLSYIVPTILLTLIFFLVLFPVSLLYKMFTKDPLMLSNKYDSFFIDVKENFDEKNFEKIW